MGGNGNGDGKDGGLAFFRANRRSELFSAAKKGSSLARCNRSKQRKQRTTGGGGEACPTDVGDYGRDA